MKIAVFVKQVEDARTVRIDSASGAASTTGEPVMNPADAWTVSEAIDLREAVGGEITAAWDLISGAVRTALAERTLTEAAAETELRPVPVHEHPRLHGAAALVAAPAFAAPVVA